MFEKKKKNSFFYIWAESTKAGVLSKERWRPLVSSWYVIQWVRACLWKWHKHSLDLVLRSFPSYPGLMPVPGCVTFLLGLAPRPGRVMLLMCLSVCLSVFLSVCLSPPTWCNYGWLSIMVNIKLWVNFEYGWLWIMGDFELWMTLNYGWPWFMDDFGSWVTLIYVWTLNYGWLWSCGDIQIDMHRHTHIKTHRHITTMTKPAFCISVIFIYVFWSFLLM